MAEPKVIIIGAGASGIAAGTRLLEKGFKDVTILEAEDRIGGRVFSKSLGDFKIDMGAQWCHGEKNNVVYEMAAPLGLLEHAVRQHDKITFIDSAGRFVPSRKAAKLHSILHVITDKTKDMKKAEGSLGDYVKTKYDAEVKKIKADPKLAELILEWYHHYENSMEASDSWFETSAKGLTEYWDCPGDLLMNWKGRGYTTILDVLMKKIPDPAKELPIKDKIQLNKEVTGIEWNGNETYTKNGGVTVKCKDGTVYKADHLIITVSLGVLKERYESLFSPAVPTYKETAIKGLGIGTVNKLIFKFPYKWWTDKDQSFGLLWLDSDKNDLGELFGGTNEENMWLTDVFGFHAVDDQPNVLIGWVSGASSRKMESLPELVVKEKVLKLLKLFISGKYDIPDPVEFIRTSWYSNPHFRGSYSFRTMASQKLQTSAAELAKPLLNKNDRPVVLFAGEATNDHYYSTVHGAVGSGWREADRIVSMYIEIPKSRIAIIGAGISGLAAAKYLHDQGYNDTIVLEAQEYAGGRIQSVPFNNGHIESGAQWIHGNDNKLWKIAKENDLLSDIPSEEGKGVYIREDGYIFDEFLVKKVDFIIGEILEECEQFFKNKRKPPESVGDFLQNKFDEYLKKSRDDAVLIELKRQLFDWHVRFQVIDNSCTNLKTVSAKDWGSYSCQSENDEATSYQAHINFKQSYTTLVETIVKNIPKENIKYNYAVKEIDWKSDDFVTIECKNGDKFHADFVLVTVSLGVLKSDNSSMFTPALPKQIKKTINKMGFYGIAKIFLEFEQKWWETDGFQLIWKKQKNDSKSRKRETEWTEYISGFDVILNHPNVLLGWVGGKGVEIVEGLSEEQVGKECVDVLKRFTGKADISYPRNVFRTQWLKNPYIRGAYSHVSNKCDTVGLGGAAKHLTQPLLGRSKTPVLTFAGEACHESYYSTTHGAYESGLQQAKVAIQAVTNKNSTK